MVTLETSKLFRNVDENEKKALRQIAQERKFSAGQEIFRERDSGDGVYVIKDGLVEISVAISEGVRRVFAQLGEGEIFGEMAVLELKPRSATALAVRDTTVYFIPRAELIVMVERSSVLSLALLREISHRLREFNQRYVQELLQAERMAVVGRFARSIIHDLKNPLSIISITAELAGMEKTLPEVRKQSQGRIRKQVERINEMVSEILDFMGGTPKDFVPASINYAEFVQPLLEEIRADTQLKNVSVEAPAPPPGVLVPLDPKRLRRVFFNLIGNATDAMSDGGKIFVRFRTDGAELVTEIEDTGPGIAPEIADKLFEAFATYGKAHGSGLGLSICKKIIEEHRGRIWVQNQPGRGAVFGFALPVAKG